MQKRFFLLIILGVLIHLSCESESRIVVDFCLQLDEKGNCIEPQKSFPYGSQVYVSCTSTQAFEGKELKGNIYFVQDGKRVFFNYKDFDLQEGDVNVNSYIPFDQFGGKGGFYVEFVDENNQILGGNELEIIE